MTIMIWRYLRQGWQNTEIWVKGKSRWNFILNLFCRLLSCPSVPLINFWKSLNGQCNPNNARWGERLSESNLLKKETTTVRSSPKSR